MKILKDTINNTTYLTKDVKCPNCKSFLRVSLNDYYSKDVLIIDDKGHAILKHINTFIFCPCCCKEFIV
jgi:hypothetical protein